MSGAMQASDIEPYPFETPDDFRLYVMALAACGRAHAVPRRQLAGAEWARLQIEGRVVYLIAADSALGACLPAAGHTGFFFLTAPASALRRL
jgi:hypothetical protein